MFIPIWIMATIFYVGFMLAVVFGATQKQSNPYDFGNGIITLGILVLSTFAYLIFWIIYLALT